MKLARLIKKVTKYISADEKGLRVHSAKKKFWDDPAKDSFVSMRLKDFNSIPITVLVQGEETKEYPVIDVRTAKINDKPFGIVVYGSEKNDAKIGIGDFMVFLEAVYMSKRYSMWNKLFICSAEDAKSNAFPRTEITDGRYIIVGDKVDRFVLTAAQHMIVGGDESYAGKTY